MYASNYFEEKMLKLMRGDGMNAPANLYLALFTTNPTDTGTAGTEVSYNGYQRQIIEFSAPTASGTGLAMQNTVDITFPESDSSAGTVSYVAVFDSDSGGNMYLYAQVSSSLVIQTGVSPVFRAGTVKWTWSGNLSTYYRTQIMNSLRGVPVSNFTPYIALCNGDPTGSGSEFSGNNYSRIAVTFSAPAQQASGVAMSQNTAQVTSAISSGSWGSLTHIAIADNATSGNYYAIKQLGATYAISANASVGFRAGELTISIN